MDGNVPTTTLHRGYLKLKSAFSSLTAFSRMPRRRSRSRLSTYLSLGLTLFVVGLMVFSGSADAAGYLPTGVDTQIAAIKTDVEADVGSLIQGVFPILLYLAAVFLCWKVAKRFLFGMG